MPRMLPSQVVTAIDSLFGASRNELDVGLVASTRRTEVFTLLALLDAIPGKLIDLNAADYVEYARCRGALATTLARWDHGDTTPAPQVGAKDAVARIRALLKQCHDEGPPAAPELPFIKDMDVRLGIEDRMRAAWTDYNAREWMGATVLAGAALEALLLWGLKEKAISPPPKKSLDELHLADLIHLAKQNALIDARCEKQAELAKDARNLIHPGKAFRSGEACSKTTALTSFAAIYRIIDALQGILAES